MNFNYSIQYTVTCSTNYIRDKIVILGFAQDNYYLAVCS